jgi:hypothetical protein
VRLLIDAGADKDVRNEVRVGRCFAFNAHFLIYISFSAFSFFALLGSLTSRVL